jgi:thioredoxin reductase (NADPH)
MQEIWDVIVLGSGPAGLTAAIYTSRANLKTLVMEGVEVGGQLSLTTLVENYPGFPKGVMGPELMESMQQQSRNFGAQLSPLAATRAELKSRPFLIETSEESFRAKTIIIATGASARMLGLESERKLLGHGVSTCATCDGFFFKDQEVVIVGGGDSAMEESLFLTKFARKVWVSHRRDKLRASKIMQDRALKNAKIGFVWNTLVEDILDPDLGKVTGVKLRDVKTNEISQKSCEGVFLAIGHVPNTEIFRGQVELNHMGYIVLKEGTRTNIPGVFAAGDVHDHVYRQAVTAAGSGCMAAIEVERFLEAEEGG